MDRVRNGSQAAWGRQARRRWPAAVATAAVLAVTALFFAAPGTYRSVLDAMGVYIGDQPFLDTSGLISYLRCHRLGVDVYVSNPCDVLGRPFNYSPSWLALSAMPVTAAWVVPASLAAIGSFLASLLLLPPGRDGWAVAAICLGVVSSATAFAAERANWDLVIFALVACAAALASCRLASRLLGYALLVVAALVKYYPLVALGLALREKPRVLAVVAAIVSLGLVTFIMVAGADLRRALALVPTSPFWDNSFGASTLPEGLAQVFDLPPKAAYWGKLVLVLGCIIGGSLLGGATVTQLALARLTQPEQAFLLAGSLLILACFILAKNMDYRAIHLLLLMPPVTALWRTSATPARSAAPVAMIVALLWADAWRKWVDGWLGMAPSPAYAQITTHPAWLSAWLLREACWWGVAILAVACSTGLLGSGAGPGVLRAGRRRPRAEDPVQ